mgnify:CR=1 FL=1
MDVDPAEDACVGGAELWVYLHPNGCLLKLEFEASSEGAASLVSGRLEADSFCPGVSDADEGTYSFSKSAHDGRAYATWVGPGFGYVPDAHAAESCFVQSTIRFYNEDLQFGDINVNLGGLQLQGDFRSEGSTSGRCPSHYGCPVHMHDGGDGLTCLDAGCLQGFTYDASREACVDDSAPGLSDAVEVAVGASGQAPVPAGGEAVFATPVTVPTQLRLFTTWDEYTVDCGIDTVMSVEVVDANGARLAGPWEDDDGGSGLCSEVVVDAPANSIVLTRVWDYNRQGLGQVGLFAEPQYDLPPGFEGAIVVDIGGQALAEAPAGEWQTFITPVADTTRLRLKAYSGYATDNCGISESMYVSVVDATGAVLQPEEYADEYALNGCSRFTLDAPAGSYVVVRARQSANDFQGLGLYVSRFPSIPSAYQSRPVVEIGEEVTTTIYGDGLVKFVTPVGDATRVRVWTYTGPSEGVCAYVTELSVKLVDSDNNLVGGPWDGVSDGGFACRGVTLDVPAQTVIVSEVDPSGVSNNAVLGFHVEAVP